MRTVPKVLPQLVQSAAEEHGDKVAIRQEEKTITFNELNQYRKTVAKSLLKMGIEKGDVIAIWAPNSIEWILAAIGIQSIGAVLAPINPKLTGAEAEDLLRRSQVKLLFTIEKLEHGNAEKILNQKHLPHLEKIIFFDHDKNQTLHSWKTFLTAGKDISQENVDAKSASIEPTDPMDILFTSGTTGQPKAVISSHQQNLRVFQTWADTVGLVSDDIYLVISPFFHSFGYKAGWLAGLITGCEILPLELFDVEKVMQTIEDRKVTMLPGAPTVYEMLLNNQNRHHYDLSSLRLGVTGAANIPVQLVKDMKEQLGFATVVTAYGLTECTGVVTICRPDDPLEIIAHTSGRAIEGVEIKCVDPKTLESCSPGTEGEVWVRGYNVMTGYYEMEEATRQTITAEGWLRTGDIGILDHNDYLRITDRLKDMYIMNGENVYPAEIEQVLYHHESIAQAAVIGVPKKPQGEVGMAFVVPKAGASISESTFHEHCRKHLARYKVPYFFKVVEGLPLNASGKVVKPILRQMAGSTEEIAGNNI